MKSIEPITIMQNFYALHHPLAMLAGVQLDVFSPLRDGPLEAAALAGTLGVLMPLPSLMYGLLFMNIYSGGKSYTEDEYREMLVNAGFTDIYVEPEVFLLGYGLVSATKI